MRERATKKEAEEIRAQGEVLRELLRTSCDIISFPGPSSHFHSAAASAVSVRKEDNLYSGCTTEAYVWTLLSSIESVRDFVVSSKRVRKGIKNKERRTGIMSHKEMEYRTNR